MKKLVFTFVLCYTCAIAFPQIRIDWQQCYGSMGFDEAFGIIQNETGGYYIVGHLGEESGMVGCDLGDLYSSWLIEIDGFGEFVGENCILDFYPSRQGLLNGNDTSFFLVGGGGGGFIEVRGYNNNADLKWIALAGNPEKGVAEIPYVASTSDGGVVATAYVQWPCGPGGEYYGMNDAWVVKINSEGEQEWEIMLGSEGMEMPACLFGESNGNVLVSIYGYAFGNGNVASCNRIKYDAIITKLSEVGEIIWSRCYGGEEEDGFSCIAELSDGYLFAGYTESEDGDLEGAGYHLGYINNLPAYGRTRDIWLMRTDFEGNILWSRCYGGAGNESAKKVFQNEDGGFTVFGTSKSIDGDVQSMANLIVPGYGIDNKLWIFRTDSEGNLLWERALGPQGTYMTQMSDVIKLDDKTYTIAATSHVVGEHQYAGDWNCSNENLCSGKSFWVLHITDIFNYDDPTGIEEQPKVVPLQMNVHPNPATTWVAINYTLPGDAKAAAIEIVNSLGVKVLQIQLNGNQGQKVLDLRELANGVYTITVLCGEYYQTEKLVITK